jgi:hypothetical protein
MTEMIQTRQSAVRAGHAAGPVAKALAAGPDMVPVDLADAVIPATGVA